MRLVIVVPPAQRFVTLVKKQRLKLHSFDVSVTKGPIGDAAMTPALDADAVGDFGFLIWNSAWPRIVSRKQPENAVRHPTVGKANHAVANGYHVGGCFDRDPTNRDDAAGKQRGGDAWSGRNLLHVSYLCAA